MKGVILAAGKGSRLYPVTHHIPKPLLPMANRPTLAYAFDKLKEMGVTDICIVVGENEPFMKDFLKDGAEYGVSLSYVRQTEPLGLAHAVSFAKDFVGDDSFVLYLGDAIYSDGFAEHASTFQSSECANLNIVKPVEDPRRFGVATVDDSGRIVRLVEKPQNPESNLAMAGLYFFGPQIWDVIPRLQPSGRGEYEITDAIQMLIDEGHHVRAGIYDHTWFDTGTLDSFLETTQFLTGGANLIDPSACVQATIGNNVVIGANATVTAGELNDCVILPDAIFIGKNVTHALIGGTQTVDADVSNEILYGTA